MGDDGERPSVEVVEGAFWLTEPAPIPDATVVRVTRLVDGSGLLDRAAKWKAQDKAGPGGRPETFPLRALFVAMVLCATANEPLLVKNFVEVLFRRISPAMRERLGVPDPPAPTDTTGWKAVYRNVRTRLLGLLTLMDPSPAPKNRRLSDHEFNRLLEVHRARHSDEVWAERYERLTWFVNAVLEMSFQLLPRDVRRRWKGHVAVDATVIPAFARPARKEKRQKKDVAPPVITHSSDPDAEWYVRREVSGDPLSGPAAKSVWAYEASLVVTGSEGGDDATYIPSLIVGMAPLHKPGHAPGANAVVALKSVRDRGHPAGFLAADRAYTEAKAENFQLPARALGYRVVLDYKKDQLGVQGSFGGMLLIEGAWYCPSIPDVLINATTDFRNGVIDESTYLARLNERWRYRIVPKEAARCRRPYPHAVPGVQPCAGGPLCELKPASLTRDTKVRLSIPVRADVAQRPPVICMQQSLTLPPEEGAKLAQDLLFGSDAWHATYGTLRNCIEGMNGYIKDGGKEAADDAHAAPYSWCGGPECVHRACWPPPPTSARSSASSGRRLLPVPALFVASRDVGAPSHCRTGSPRQ